jgi:hypothetical protein
MADAVRKSWILPSEIWVEVIIWRSWGSWKSGKRITLNSMRAVKASAEESEWPRKR